MFKNVNYTVRLYVNGPLAQSVERGAKYLLLASFAQSVGQVMDRVFPSFYGPSAKRTGHENKEGKNEDP